MRIIGSRFLWRRWWIRQWYRLRRVIWANKGFIIHQGCWKVTNGLISKTLFECDEAWWCGKENKILVDVEGDKYIKQSIIRIIKQS